MLNLMQYRHTKNQPGRLPTTTMKKQEPLYTSPEQVATPSYMQFFPATMPATAKLAQMFIRRVAQ
jgi:hypothetical protein